jgi:zinc transport system permease protein
MDDFLVRALVGALGVAAVAGPLGTVVVWSRMAFFGDALAHAALLGIVVGFVLEVNPMVGVALVGVVVAAAMFAAAEDPRLAPDSLLATVSYGTLALGMALLGFVPGARGDLLGLLFGDVLAIGRVDLAWMYGVGALALAGLVLIWRRLLAVVVHAEMAAVEGARVRGVRAVFLLILAATVAVGMKVVGVLLVTALLVIPAIAARPFARSPEAMALMAALAGVVAVVAGLGVSLAWDVASGPAIVCAAVALFLASRVGSVLGGRRA